MGALYRDLVRKHSTATGSARAVLNILADYADDTGVAWPSRATIANDAGMSERNVIRCLQKLCADGHLVAEENARGGRGNVPHYRISISENAQPEAVKGDKLSQEKGDKSVNAPTKRVTNESLKGDKSAQKGDNLSLKGDKCVENQSYARSEPHEPQLEPQDQPSSSQSPQQPDSLQSDDEEDKRITKTLVEKLHSVGVQVTPHSVERYWDFINDYGIEATLRGITAAANNGKQHYLNYVSRCVISAAQGDKRASYSGNTQTNGYRKPEVSQHSMSEHRAYDAQRRAEGRPF